MNMKICRQCGTEIFDGEAFCYSCGYSGQPMEYDTVTSSASSSKNKLIPLLLSLLGLVNIFGLGQLYLRKYIRAAIFLSLSVAFFAIAFIYDVKATDVIFISALTIVFCAQIFDVSYLLSRPQQ